MLQKLDVLAEAVKRKKLDTNMDLLKSHLIGILNIWPENGGESTVLPS
jgi:hypothetical protein